MLDSKPKLKNFLLWMLMHPYTARPRWWTRTFVIPFVIDKGKGVIIRRSARLDLVPSKKLKLGYRCVVEDFTVINNGAGDVVIGDKARIGIGSVVIGPVTMGDGVGLGQHVFVSGFNHGYADGTRDSNDQPLVCKGVTIGREAHIGANSVVVAGVTIGERCQIGAGSVVTKDIPPYSVAVGNPARVIKRFDHEKNEWVKA